MPTCHPAPFQFPAVPPAPTVCPGRYQLAPSVGADTRVVRVIVEHLPAGVALLDYLDRAGFRAT